MAKSKPTSGGDSGSNALKFGPAMLLALAAGATGLWTLSTDEALLGSLTSTAGPRQPGDGLTAIGFGVCACLGACAIFDLSLGWLFAARYYVLHVAVNLAIVILSVADGSVGSFLRATNPNDTNTCLRGGVCSSKTPLAFTTAIHLWHCAAYSVKPIDLVHHVPALLVCAIGLWFPWGPVINWSLAFAFMGVPGGIDYALLALVKGGKLPARFEKEWNQMLNVWLRCPSAVIAAYLSMIGPMVSPEDYAGMAHRACHWLAGLHDVWNGCFFMYRTVDARTRFVIAAKAEKER